MANDGNLYAASIACKHDQRRHSFIQEIRKLNFFAGFVQDFVLQGLNGFQIRPEQVVLTLRNGIQNMVSDWLSAVVGPCP
jgi:hypothetical protein